MKFSINHNRLNEDDYILVLSRYYVDAGRGRTPASQTSIFNITFLHLKTLKTYTCSEANFTVFTKAANKVPLLYI